jgi:adenine-specific DNA-methyltransferase
MEKITNGHPLSQSPDIVKENIETLKVLFPTIVKEGKIDIEELKALLGDEQETNDEYYRFTWAGKAMARREANKPSTATLRPNKKDSKDWDTTQNIFIEGDNLEALKLLQKSYANQVKMIYIDPPYNTGSDFVYNDDYADNLSNYLTLTGQKDEEGLKISTNSETSGRYHSNWLNMIYPRIKLARNLLSEDGVIFISIDDNEVVNLKKVCDEVLGEENFIANIIWQKSKKGDAKLIAKTHEYVLLYSKSMSRLLQSGIWRVKKLGAEEVLQEYETLKSTYGHNHDVISQEIKKWYNSLGKEDPRRAHSHYSYSDDRGLYFADNFAGPDDGRTSRPRYEIIHPVTLKQCKKPSTGWRWDEERTQRALAEQPPLIHFGIDETTIPCRKSYLKDIDTEPFASVFYRDGRGGTITVERLIGKGLFNFPKDVDVIANFIKLATRKDSVVLDFFAGSGTTAHAVMQLNEEDGGKRRFFCVQLPEQTQPDSAAFKAGFRNIADITKERIRKAGEVIESQTKTDMFHPEQKLLDVGFRAFKLDSSNIKAWDGDPESLDKNLFNTESNIKEDRMEEDVLYEILLKYGLDLTIAIEQKKIDGKAVFNIGMGALFICLGTNITTAVADGIGKWKQEQEPASCRVIFRDNGFTDVEKTNSIQTLKRYGIEEVNSI